jgi:hypothetical protein
VDGAKTTLGARIARWFVDVGATIQFDSGVRYIKNDIFKY